MLYIVSIFSASYLYVFCVMKHISENVKSQKRELIPKLLPVLFQKHQWKEVT